MARNTQVAADHHAPPVTQTLAAFVALNRRSELIAMRAAGVSACSVAGATGGAAGPLEVGRRPVADEVGHARDCRSRSRHARDRARRAGWARKTAHPRPAVPSRNTRCARHRPSGPPAVRRASGPRGRRRRRTGRPRAPSGRNVGSALAAVTGDFPSFQRASHRIAGFATFKARRPRCRGGLSAALPRAANRRRARQSSAWVNWCCRW